ncbi:hypothetical protein SAMN05216436_12930 [bacterium A37T11]|nr:hypothetical protein SAMN05216436_12930 [bacterium A37T11]
MAKAVKKKQITVINKPQRPIDRYFTLFNQSHQHPVNLLLSLLAIQLIFFGVFGLVWIQPFPEISFLKRHGYDTYINWASIFIAIIVYAYLRLSPMLSYIVLLNMGVYAFFIVQLEHWAAGGGPAVWLCCLALLFVAGLLLILGAWLEGRNSGLKFLLLGPIWSWYLLFRRFRLPY